MKSNIAPEMLELKAEIAKFLVLHNLAPSAFGELACNDRGLLGKMEKGRELRFETRQRIEEFMTTYNQQQLT